MDFYQEFEGKRKLLRIIPTNSLSWSELSGSEEELSEEIPCNQVGLAILENGNYVLVDKAVRQVKVFSKEGHFIEGIGQRDLLTPEDVAVTGSGKIVVTDSEAGNVKVFSQRGKLLLTSEFGLHLIHPTGIDYNPVTKSIAICDPGANCVYVHDHNGIVQQVLTIPKNKIEEDQGSHSSQTPQSGASESPTEILQRITSLDSRLSKYPPFSPSYVKFNNHTNTIAITDATNNSVYVFNSSGKLRAEFRAQDKMKLAGVCADGNGNVYVADFSTSNIHQLDPEKGLREPILRKADGIDNPVAIAINAKGHLVVAEGTKGFIKVFKIDYT